MPEVGDLPDELKGLVRRNALQLSHERSRTDSERLASAVERALEKTAAERREGEEKERLEAEHRETEAKERFKAEQRQKEEQERLESKRQERGRAAAKPTAPVAAVIPSPPVIATPTVEEKVRSSLERATTDNPWVNSLGMKFVPVAGTQALFSVWDTRVQDFEAFVADTNYDATEPGFSQGPTHPVVGVTWNGGKRCSVADGARAGSRDAAPRTGLSTADRRGVECWRWVAR